VAASSSTDRFGRFIPDGSWPAGREAPGELERLRRFLNTSNPESGAEHFVDGPDVRAWLVREDHDDPGRLDADDATRVRGARDGLRRAIIAADLSALDHALAGASLTVRFEEGGTRLAPTGTGVERIVSWLAATIHDAVLDGSWPRLKACANPHCRWVTFDRSKNASGTWCSMTACGARARARAYRARQKEHRRET